MSLLRSGEDMYSADPSIADDPDMPLSGYLSLLRPGGNFILVGAPEKPLPQITPFELIPRHVSLGGTMIVSRKGLWT